MSENKTSKHYLLYNNKAQEKLLTTASSEEQMLEETNYYSGGTWFEYDTTEGSSILSNEKVKTGVKFPKQPQQRILSDLNKKSEEKILWLK